MQKRESFILICTVDAGHLDCFEWSCVRTLTPPDVAATCATDYLLYFVKFPTGERLFSLPNIPHKIIGLNLNFLQQFSSKQIANFKRLREESKHNYYKTKFWSAWACPLCTACLLELTRDEWNRHLKWSKTEHDLNMKCFVMFPNQKNAWKTFSSFRVSRCGKTNHNILCKSTQYMGMESGKTIVPTSSDPKLECFTTSFADSFNSLEYNSI